MFYKLDVLRWKHLFTHGKPRKESGARLIVTFLFFQFCLECENVRTSFLMSCVEENSSQKK